MSIRTEIQSHSHIVIKPAMTYIYCLRGRKGMVIVMGMTVGKISGNSNGYVKIDLYNRDGSYAGSLAVSTSRTKTSKSKSTSKTGQKKYKKLQYNFKRLSNQIMRTKTSVNAKQLVTKTKFQIADLKMKLISGDYSYEEVHNAIVHAEKIARVAKKRMKNLEEEEYLEKTGRNDEMDLEEMQARQGKQKDEILDTTGMSQEEMEQLMQELQEEMEKIEEELEKAMDESEKLMEEFVQGSNQQMNPEDLEELKKKHRSEELRDIMKADMEYLKALFNRLAREKESAGSSSSNSSSDSSSNMPISGVSLEIGGVDVPVETVAEASVEVAGASVDVSV